MSKPLTPWRLLSADDPIARRIDAAIHALGHPGVVIACLSDGPSLARIVTAMDDLNPALAEACALDLLRGLQARMRRDGGSCLECPTCQARLARLAAAIDCLTLGSGPMPAAEVH